MISGKQGILYRVRCVVSRFSFSTRISHTNRRCLSELRALLPPHQRLDSLHTCRRDLAVLRRCARGDSNGTNHDSINLNRYATSNEGELPAIAVVNTICHSTGHEILTRVAGGVYCSGKAVAGSGEGLVDGDVDRGQFRVGHADEVHEVEGGVDEGDIEVLSWFLSRLLECSRNGFTYQSREIWLSLRWLLKRSAPPPATTWAHCGSP